jgi:transcription elongation factor Elf1
MINAWTDERRKKQSDAAKARWANPFYRENHGKSIQKPPCCPACGELNISQFYVDKKGRRTNKHCRNCHKKKCMERWHNIPALDRQASRAYKYGITADAFKQMHMAQNGKCAICNTTPKTKRGLHVDHNHGTGKVRGLLCHGCNVALGSFKEDLNLLNKAIEYLRSNHG